jgi:hypothetical protein
MARFWRTTADAILLIKKCSFLNWTQSSAFLDLWIGAL